MWILSQIKLIELRDFGISGKTVKGKLVKQVIWPKRTMYPLFGIPIN